MLPEKINELVGEFLSAPVVGDLNVGLTQYSLWLIIAAIVLCIVLFAFMKRQTLVPKGFFVNGLEYVIQYVEDDVARGVAGTNWKQHTPFLLSIFLFILMNNLIGLIPGMKPGTGAIGCTAALAIVAFVYFIYYGIKSRGLFGYLKSLAPEGVNGPLVILIWLIEVVSTFLRLITLAVRLFCNMFAGHIVMGTFAVMATLFISPLAQGVSAMAIGGGVISIAWMVILLLIYAIEMLVSVIQAYVFTVLTAAYIEEAEKQAE